MIASGKYAGQRVTVEANLFQGTVYPREFANGHHIVLDIEVLVTMEWERFEALR